jgi:hypothetical protein
MAGTVSIVHNLPQPSIGRIVATCTGDAANGSFPATALPAFEGHLLELITDPGATAPTDNYDITLVDANGFDRLQGVGANRDTAVTEAARIVYSTTSTNPVVALSDVLTLTLANNSVNSAVVVVTILYGTGPG